jgi:tetratricopeptide (TPR) repeat protein
MLCVSVLHISGCAAIPESVRELPNPDIVLELSDTPFFPQQMYQCGPAALATALAASGLDVVPGDLIPKVYLPGRKGSLQVELLAATRTSGRLPYLLDPTLAALADELQAGRPVIVLQNLGVSMIPRWHYAVIVGVDGTNDTVVLRSGTEERRLTPMDLFLRTWKRGDFWAMTVLRPGELPTNVDRRRYLAAAADLEQVGMLSAATSAWRAALQQWPDDAVARFGLGNTLLSLDQPVEAERVYRELIAARPELVAARNNLAMALYGQGHYEDAMFEVDTALKRTDDAALIGELLDSKKEIQAAISPPRH